MPFFFSLKIFALNEFWRQLLFAGLLFYLFALFQSSFLVHLSIKGAFPNLLLVAVLLVNFLESPSSRFGKMAGFLGGFFLDIFSALPLGSATLTLGLLPFVVKKISSHFKRINLLSFFFLLILGLLIYEVLLPLFMLLFGFALKTATPWPFMSLSYVKLIALAYNTFLGLLGFFLFQSFRNHTSER